MAQFVARLYRVAKAGYYEYGADTPSLGGVEFLFDELEAWGAGKTLEQTKLPTPSDTLPTYLMSVGRRGTCRVVVLWNEVPSSEGAVASVSRTSRVGHPTIHANAIAANSIAGFPTYFACFPDDNFVITLRYNDVVTGLQSFKNYVSVFQELSTSLAVVEESTTTPGEYVVLAYRDGDGNELQNLHARFDLQLQRSGNQRAKILAQFDSIRKIVRVKEMDPTVVADRQRYQRFLDWLGITRPPPGESVKFRQELAIRPTRAEVAAIIDQVMEDVEPRINDVGFVFRGGGSPLWLSGSIPSRIIDIDVQAVDGVFDASSLANLISRRRAAILDDLLR